MTEDPNTVPHTWKVSATNTDTKEDSIICGHDYHFAIDHCSFGAKIIEGRDINVCCVTEKHTLKSREKRGVAAVSSPILRLLLMALDFNFFSGPSS